MLSGKRKKKREWQTLWRRKQKKIYRKLKGEEKTEVRYITISFPVNKEKYVVEERKETYKRRSYNGIRKKRNTYIYWTTKGVKRIKHRTSFHSQQKEKCTDKMKMKRKWDFMTINKKTEG